MNQGGSTTRKVPLEQPAPRPRMPWETIPQPSQTKRNAPLPQPYVPKRQQLADDDTLMNFRVDLDVFRGPLDLLLYLVRKHELPITDIPVAPIADQFLEHLAVLEHLDVNAAGDFLEMASTLLEIKSKLLLPQADENDDEAADESWEDPRQQLVQQLLEYKQYRDAASVLEERGRAWSQCYARLANDLPPREIDPADQPIHEVELWDLVSAMGRVLRANELARPTNIVYDDTPIQAYMQRIHTKLCDDGQVAFSDMFQPSMHKSAMIGVFLAVLELVRHHAVIAEQEAPHGEIYLLPGDDFASDLDLSDVDDYSGAVKPR